MKIAVEGCAHGELDKIYDAIKLLEENENIEVDLLICCGDFQSSRNEHDLDCMAVSMKYRNMCSFYKYYNGEKVAPVLTIFIGGNHEASNFLQELPYGGWVAPNIYYLGYAGVINIAGVRIAGLSGIYKANDYLKGHYEIPPYSQNSIRSVYHVRNLEIFRLKQLHGNIDIFISHDWPGGVTQYGNCRQLLKHKPHFQNDIESGQLGNPHTETLLKHLMPSYWFAAHLHYKFAALIPHSNEKVTKFLALDKCLPNRKFLQILEVPHDTNLKMEISYDLEWLTILYLTNHLLSIKNVTHYMPGPNGSERFNFTPTTEEKQLVSTKFGNNLIVPLNFVQTQPGHNNNENLIKFTDVILNPQTKLFCRKLGIDDPVNLILKHQPNTANTSDDDDNEDGDMTFPSFINDSEMFEQTHDSSLENTSFNKSFKLNLPEPKCLDISELTDSNKNTVEADTPESDSNLDVDNVMKIEYNDTPVKKFKRRNADMYTNAD